MRKMAKKIYIYLGTWCSLWDVKEDVAGEIPIEPNWTFDSYDDFERDFWLNPDMKFYHYTHHGRYDGSLAKDLINYSRAYLHIDTKFNGKIPITIFYC